MSRWAALACLPLALLAVSAFAQVSDPKPGIVGSDDRTITSDERFTAVGRLNLSGKGFCTATLIAPQVVITAAHCTFYPRTGKPIPADRIHFAAGWRQGKPLAHSVAKHVRRHPRYEHGKPISADIAIIVLAEPINDARITPIPIDRETERVRLIVPLTLVSYARDRPHLPSVESGCVVRSVQGRVLLTDCDSHFGASGAPILHETAEGFAVLGVVSGVIEQNGLRRVAAIRAFMEEK